VKGGDGASVCVSGEVDDWFWAQAGECPLLIFRSPPARLRHPAWRAVYRAQVGPELGGGRRGGERARPGKKKRQSPPMLNAVVFACTKRRPAAPKSQPHPSLFIARQGPPYSPECSARSLGHQDPVHRPGGGRKGRQRRAQRGRYRSRSSSSRTGPATGPALCRGRGGREVGGDPGQGELVPHFGPGQRIFEAELAARREKATRGDLVSEFSLNLAVSSTPAATRQHPARPPPPQSPPGAPGPASASF